MGESRAERISRLLSEGLDHYGEGRVEEAERIWAEVLFLDPGNEEARDYLESLETDGDSKRPRKAKEPRRAAAQDLADDALKLMRDGHLEAALELLETLARRDAGRLELQGYLEMVRSRLLDRYRERVGGMDVVPSVRVGARELLKFNLPASTGFLLSLVDGKTSVNDLISLSGLDPFETLRMLANLLDAGVVECDS
jgi:tetratricopeptide (TPR) repeat protein